MVSSRPGPAATRVFLMGESNSAKAHTTVCQNGSSNESDVGVCLMC